jgi:hypothetical protein
MILKTLETVECAWRDLRFACRLLRRQPLFAAAAIVTVALGVGANTAVVRVLETVIRKKCCGTSETVRRPAGRSGSAEFLVISRAVFPRDSA